jgi:hypothetical protein
MYVGSALTYASPVPLALLSPQEPVDVLKALAAKYGVPFVV